MKPRRIPTPLLSMSYYQPQTAPSHGLATVSKNVVYLKLLNVVMPLFLIFNFNNYFIFQLQLMYNIILVLCVQTSNYTFI